METLPKLNGIEPRYVHLGHEARPEAAARHDDPHPGAREGRRPLLPRRRSSTRACRGLQGFSRHAARRRRQRRRGSRAGRSRPTSAPPTSASCSRACCRTASRSRRQGIVDPEQPQRRAADRVEEAPAAVRRRRRVGRRVQGRQAQRQLERDVGEAPQDAPEGAARLPQDRPSRQHQRHAAARGRPKTKKATADGVYAILDTILPVPKKGEAHRPGDRLDRTGVLQPDSGVQAAGRPRPAREQHADLRRRAQEEGASTRRRSG